MTTVEKALAGTALAVAIGLFVAASRTDEGRAPPRDPAAAAAPPAPQVQLGADGYPLEPTEGMLESEWRRIQALRAAAAAAGRAGLDGAGAAPVEAPDDGVVDSAELAGVDPAAFEQVAGSLDASREGRLALLGECNQRRQALRAPGATAMPLDLELSVVSAGGVGRVVAVNADWPADVDTDGIACFQQAYLGHEFATDHDYSYRYRWPVCAPTPGAGRDDGPHPEIPATVIREL